MSKRSSSTPKNKTKKYKTTFQELYLERLQKWREEKAGKQKPLTEIKLNNVSCPPKESLKVVTKQKPVHIKPVAAKKQPQKSETKAQKRAVSSNSRTSASETSVSQNASQCGLPTKRRDLAAEDQEFMEEKLKKWKEQKVLSVKKEQKPASEKKIKELNPELLNNKQDPKKYKTVKSRLFDYLHKPAKSTSDTKPSDHLKKTERGNVVKPKKDSKTVVSVKTGIKRRHSEVSHEPAKKPAGILKRKSCIPSIESCGDDKTLNSCIDNNTERPLDDNVFLSTNYTNKAIPVAMVTPGTAAVTPSTARNVRFMSPERSKSDGEQFRKTPLKPTEMRNQLNDWLKAKGKTPSKFRHLMCFHAELEEGKSNDPQTKASLSVEELTEQMDVILLEQEAARAEEKLTTMLEECMTLFEAGCPVKDIMPWLDDIYKNIPLAKTSAQFYECKANVIKSTLDLDMLLEVFETAMINGAQPREQIAKILTESIKHVTNEQLKAAKRRKGTPRRSGVQEENMFQSSAIVYTVSEVTPFSESKTSRRSESSAQKDNCKVITPVRRSTRRSLQNLPSSLKDKKDMYRSLTDVDDKQREHMLFQPNMALDSLLAQAEEQT